MKKPKNKRNLLTQRVQTIQNNLRKNGIKLSMTEIRKWFLKIWDVKDNRLCGICGERMELIDDVSLDHILPVSRKGKPTLDNCQIVHKDCNQIKGDFTLEEIKYLLSINPDALKILKNRLKQSTLMYKRYNG